MRRLPLLLLSSLPLLAGDAAWPDIPAEVWTLKAEGSLASGAVVLQDRLHLHSRSLDHFRRILVLSEAGRQAANAMALAGKVKALRGRTVNPDGSVSAFESDKDFIQKDGVRVGRRHIKTHILIPPGVSTHCIVDMSWTEPVDDIKRPIPSRYGYTFEWLLAGEFPTRSAEVWIDKNATPADWNYKFEAGPGTKSEVKHTADADGYLFQDVPARGDLAFGREIDQGLPRFFYFWTPELSYDLWALYGGGNRTMPTISFWDGASQAVYARILEEDTKRGKGFDAFWRELSKDLPADPAGKARLLLDRLKARIRNTEYLSIEEQGEITDEDLRKSTLRAQNLDDAITRGSTNNFGMVLLYFHLLRREGIQPTLGLSVDPDHGRFRPEQSNLFQFDYTFVGVPDGKGILWADPAFRHLDAGVIPAPFQGELILGVQTDPDAKKWKSSLMRLPVQGGDLNQRRYEVRLGDGGRAFKVDAAFKGYPEVVEKARFERHDAAEQSRLLKERIEPWLGEAILDKAEVRGAREIGVPLTWTLAGHSDVELGRRWTIEPFATVPDPFDIPSSWPETRTVAISLPDLSRQEASCAVELPSGAQMVDLEPIHKVNRFGKVDWTHETRAGAEGKQELLIKLTIETLTLRTGPDHYAEIREFAQWVQEAMRRKVQLTIPGK